MVDGTSEHSSSEDGVLEEVDGSSESCASDSRVLEDVAFMGYRFLGNMYYDSREWFTFEFPAAAAKFYVFKLAADWSCKVYTKVRLRDTGFVNASWGRCTHWHCSVEFAGAAGSGAPVVEVNFRSHGKKRRGEGEVFDYSEVDIARLDDSDLHDYEQPWGYRRSYTSDMSSHLSYNEIVETVASVALSYPYFTFVDEGSFSELTARMENSCIKEGHCGIFSDELLRLLTPDLPIDASERRAVMAEIARCKRGRGTVENRWRDVAHLICRWPVVCTSYFLASWRDGSFHERLSMQALREGCFACLVLLLSLYFVHRAVF